MFKVKNKDTKMTPSVSIVNFEHVIAGWVNCILINHAPFWY